MPKRLPITDVTDARWARALAHPIRIRLLALLEANSSSPVVLAEELGQSLGTVAYHVRVLYDLGLIELVRTRQRRGATEHYYRAATHPRISDEGWAQMDPISKQRFLTGVLGQIQEQAFRSAAAGGFDAADAHFTRTPLKLDAKGWTKLAKATKRWLDEADRIERESATRLSKDPHGSLEVALVILLFEAATASTEHADDRSAKHTDRSSAPRRRRQNAGV